MRSVYGRRLYRSGLLKQMSRTRDTQSKNNLGAIIGGSVGGGVALIGIVVAVVLIVIKKKKNINK